MAGRVDVFAVESTSPASWAPGTDSCIRFKIRRNVDFPQPEGPMRAVDGALASTEVTSSRTWVPPNQAETSTASRRAPPLGGLRGSTSGRSTPPAPMSPRTVCGSRSQSLLLL